MPYIKPEQRELLQEPLLDVLRTIRRLAFEQAKAQSDDGTVSEADEMTAAAGILNFCCTSLAVNLMGKPRYWKIAILTGTLNNVAQEFYDRVARPYEDGACAKNGDVYECPHPDNRVHLVVASAACRTIRVCQDCGQELDQ